MRMTDQERVWFKELVKDRADSARTLKKDSMRGYRQSPINKYSDRAHFVYEFLQNADDVKASKCAFSLSQDGLIFSHNGKILFNVSNPGTELQDRNKERLGGVNAITAAGLSTKSENEIGRFGIGFKAVFQYTDGPEIYDDNIRFGLKDEIVPYLIKDDFAGRKPGETCFYVPFRSAEKERAYSDIKDKIVSIMHPLLFLSNLKEISFNSSELTGQYSKEVCDSKYYRENDSCIEVEFLILKSKFGDKETETKVLKFSTETTDGRVAVVLGIDDKDGSIRLIPLQCPVFCFFPTKKETGLNFLIHAPFLLNDSREGIKEGNEHNIKLIVYLANLAVNAINLLESKIPSEIHNWFGRRECGVKIIDDGILDYVPLNLKETHDEISLKAFELCFNALFTTQAVIPCQSGDDRELVYRKKENVSWSSDCGLINLLTPTQLASLLDQPSMCWGFATVNGSKLSSEKESFIKICCGNIVSWSSIWPKMTAGFFEQQPIEWFKNFFDYLVQNRSRDLDAYKTLPMFLNGDGRAVSAFDKDDHALYHALYLPDEGVSTAKTVHKKLLEFESVKKIVELWGIKKESQLAVVNRIVREDLVNDDACMYEQGLIRVLKFCETCSNEDLQKVGDLFIKYPALMVYNPSKERKWKARSVDCYFINDDLLFYFKGINDVPFVDMAYLDNIVGDEYRAALKTLFSVLKIRSTPKCITELLSRDEAHLIYGETRTWTKSYYLKAYGKIEKWEDFYLDYSKEFLERFMAETEINARKKMSGIFWKFLCKMIEEIVPAHKCIKDEMIGIHHYFQYGWKTETFTPYLCEVLREKTWLFDERGELRPHAELFVEALNDMYDVHSTASKQLLELLGIKHDERLWALNTLSDDERQDLKAAKDIREAGLGSVTEARSILGIIPAEIRQKICSGALTTEKILKAVGLLEQVEASGRVTTTMSQDSSATIEHVPTPAAVDIITALTSDENMGGLAVAEQHDVLVEAKEMVRKALESEGYEFTKGICEKECSVINGVKKGGIEYPLVVHSYIDRSRPFQLNAADWAQLMKPNSMLLVRTEEGICPVPFKNLVCNRDKIDFSISTKDNLDMSDRLASLAHVMRWFKGLHFDFGSLVPMKAGTAQLFDLPENPMTDEQKKSQMAPDSVEEL